MTSISRILGLLVVFTFLLQACGDPKAKINRGGGRPDPTKPEPRPVPTFDAARLNYNNVKAVVFVPHCNLCHAPESEFYVQIDLSTYETVHASIELIHDRVLFNERFPMPPRNRPALSVEQKNLLEDWISVGAPLGASAATPEPTPTPPSTSVVEPTPTPLVSNLHGPSAPPDVLPRPLPNGELSFSQYRRVLFTPHCARCHDPDAVHYSGVDLSTYSGVVSWITEIEKDVLIFGVMPPRQETRVPEGVKDFLRQWISAGVPETQEESSVTSTSLGIQSMNPLRSSSDFLSLSPLEPTFASIKTNIFRPLCLDCHAAGGRAADLPLGTLPALRGIEPSIINTETPANSSLVRRLRGQGGRIMPPPSTGRTPLTAAQVDVIIQWIQAGLPAR